KILPLQHLLKCDPAVQTNDIFVRHRPEPVSVANCLRARWVENLERLLAIGFGIGHHLLMSQMRPGDRSTARIANHSGEITDDENGLVPGVLKLAQFAQNNGVAEVDVRGRRINPKFYSERPAKREFLA